MAEGRAELVLCTTPDGEVAERLAKLVVGEGLAACVSIIPKVRSVYRWQGEVHIDDEHQLLVKTWSTRRDALIARLAEAHPYDVPELIALPIESGFAPYLSWIEASTES